jgi:uncharacterized membrane protein YgcG
MRKALTGLLFSAALLGPAVFAFAGDFGHAGDCDEDGFWHEVHIGWHRNNEWPHPFICADRNYAVSPFAVMIANGWQRQNLIGENYFEDGDKKLNSAGIERIRSILRQAPVEHRVLFVQRDLNEQVTNARLDLVQEAVASIQPKGPLPEVVISNMVPEGRSAEIVAAELNGYVKSPPMPRLSSHSSGGGGSGGSSSGGGSSGGGSGGSN